MEIDSIKKVLKTYEGINQLLTNFARSLPLLQPVRPAGGGRGGVAVVHYDTTISKELRNISTQHVKIISK